MVNSHVHHITMPIMCPIDCQIYRKHTQTYYYILYRKKLTKSYNQIYKKMAPNIKSIKLDKY